MAFPMRKLNDVVNNEERGKKELMKERISEVAMTGNTVQAGRKA